MTEAKVCDQAYIRQSNTHSVLRLLRAKQPISRKDIARLTGMSPTSITRIVNALLDRSLIAEEGHDQRAAGRGRRAIHLTTDPNGLYTLGIYVDRVSLRLCVLGFHGQTLHSDSMVLADAVHAPVDIAMAAHSLFMRMPGHTLSHPSRLAGIGISVPGIVDHRTSLIKKSIRMRWDNINLRQPFEKAFGLPVWLENDVKAGLVGEKQRLGIPEDADVAYLFLGNTGIGASMTSGGKLVRGENNAAGEVARIVLAPSGTACDCGRPDCLQLHLTETLLLQRARKADPSVRSMADIIVAFRQRIAWAEAVFDGFHRHLQLMLSLLDSFYNPTRIIISGDIFAKLGMLAEEILSDDHIIIAPDYQGASLMGAAMIAMEQVLQQELLNDDEN